jgi:hypothetical protein
MVYRSNRTNSERLPSWKDGIYNPIVPEPFPIRFGTERKELSEDCDVEVVRVIFEE